MKKCCKFEFAFNGLIVPVYVRDWDHLFKALYFWLRNIEKSWDNRYFKAFYEPPLKAMEEHSIRMTEQFQEWLDGKGKE